MITLKQKLLITSALLIGMSNCSHFKNPKKKKFKSQTHAPRLLKPEVKKIWVEDQIQGNRYVEGHFEYLIEEGVKWTK